MNRKHPDDPDPTWWGDSIGWYEGDTFVVDTVGFNDKTWLDQVGRPHTESLHLVQRFHRVDKEHLQLDVTFDDPKAYTKPWTGQKCSRNRILVSRDTCGCVRTSQTTSLIRTSLNRPPTRQPRQNKRSSDDPLATGT